VLSFSHPKEVDMPRKAYPGLYQFTDCNGYWERRPIDTAGPWQRLHVVRIGTPPDRNQAKGPDNNKLPSIYRWDWKE
jgi:hypothetical protein